MKLYVDELPKCCSDCPFYRLDVYVDLDGYEIHSNECFLEGSVLTYICPLQPLSDHDKQVRKEVCEEIGKQLGLRFDGKWQVVTDGSMTGDKTIMAVLDQIQGETK